MASPSGEYRSTRKHSISTGRDADADASSTRPKRLKMNRVIQTVFIGYRREGGGLQAETFSFWEDDRRVRDYIIALNLKY